MVKATCCSLRVEPESLHYHWNVSTVGAFLSGASFLLFFYIMYKTLTSGEKLTEPAYWGEHADTLEWTLPNPPPAHTFEQLPTRDMWDKPAH